MRRLFLLGVAACCACVLVAADSQPDQQGDRSFPEEDGVLQLKKSNFNRALRKHKQLLVHFCKLHAKTHTAWLSPARLQYTGKRDIIKERKTKIHLTQLHVDHFLVYTCLFLHVVDTPLSGEGNQITAAFKDAAAELQGSEVKLAVVDVTQEKDLAKQLNATGPPAVRLYLSGDKHNPVPCPGMWSKWQILQHSEFMELQFTPFINHCDEDCFFWRLKTVSVLIVIQFLTARHPSWPGWNAERGQLLTSSLISANQRPQRSSQWWDSLGWEAAVWVSFTFLLSDAVTLPQLNDLCVRRSSTTSTSVCSTLQPLTFLTLPLLWHRTRQLSANMVSHRM